MVLEMGIQYYFQQMKEEEKQQFVDFPIYVFAN